MKHQVDLILRFGHLRRVLRLEVMSHVLLHHTHKINIRTKGAIQANERTFSRQPSQGGSMVMKSALTPRFPASQMLHYVTVGLLLM
jgi:hypothetical protein